MEVKEIFAKRLVNLREKNGITQQALADDLGITRQSLSLYENAERTINIDLLVKVSKYFDVSNDYLLGLQKEPTNDPNVTAVTEYTSLSKEAVEKLNRIGLRNKATANSDTLSAMIEDEDFEYFLALLSAKMCTDNNSIKSIYTGNARMEIKVSSLTNYEIGQSISEISTRMKDKFIEKYKTVDERQEYLFHQKMYSLAESLLKENRITEQEYNRIIDEYDKGNFEYEIRRKV